MAILKLVYSNNENQVIKTYDKSYYEKLSLDKKNEYVLYEDSGNHYYILKNALNFSTKESKYFEYDNLLKLMKDKEKDIKRNLKENGKIFKFYQMKFFLNINIFFKKFFNFLEEDIIPPLILLFLGYSGIHLYFSKSWFYFNNNINYFIVFILLSLFIDSINQYLKNSDDKIVNKMNILLSDYKNSISIKEVEIIENEVIVDTFKFKMDNELVDNIKFKIEQKKLLKKDFS